METAEEKLARSLTAESTDLIPFLPYLLQDLWELGSSPDDILFLITRHIPVTPAARILDLACGKGAVSVKTAKALGCRVKGIDWIEDFIRYADTKAMEYGVQALCEFVAGDINAAVEQESGYDIVIYGAVGDVLGGPAETLCKLKGTVRPGGYVLIDDAYAREDYLPGYQTRDQWIALIGNTGMRLVGELIAGDNTVADVNDEQQALIAQRAVELKRTHPDKTALFDEYIESQLAECADMENRLSCVTILLQVVDDAQMQEGLSESI